MLNRDTEEYMSRLRKTAPDADPMWWFDCDTCGRRSVAGWSIRYACREAAEAGWMIDDDGHATCPACRALND